MNPALSPISLEEFRRRGAAVELQEALGNLVDAEVARLITRTGAKGGEQRIIEVSGGNNGQQATQRSE